MPTDFHDVLFPTNIAYGATGGPGFSTTVVSTESGFEQRISNWNSARMAWTITLDVWDEARMAELIAFFRARRGRAYGFRFRDWSDYYVGMTLASGSLQYLPASQAQAIGVGNGSTKAFQLVKTYASGSTVETRKITRPVSGSVKVYVGGVEQTSGWTLDYSTGVLTFAVAPANGAAVAWAGKFDVPARFDTDEMNLNIEAVMQGQWSSLKIVELRE